MLFTAQTYVDRITDENQQQAAKQQLALLIRCQHLSLQWLSTSLLSADRTKLLLSDSSKELGRLLMLRAADGNNKLDINSFRQLLPDAPSSWSLPKRRPRPIPNVQLKWSLDISKVKEAAESCASRNKAQLRCTRQVRHRPWVAYLGGCCCTASGMKQPRV